MDDNYDIFEIYLFQMYMGMSSLEFKNYIQK